MGSRCKSLYVCILVHLYTCTLDCTRSKYLVYVSPNDLCVCLTGYAGQKGRQSDHDTESIED